MTSDQELILNTLIELVPLELMQFQWHLSQGVLKDFPPIPKHWLRVADTQSTIKAMVKCYGDEGAVRITAEILRKMDWDGQVDELHSRFPYYTVLPAPKAKAAPKQPTLDDFLRRFRSKLVNRMQHTEPILDALQEYDVLTEAEREAICIYSLQDKNRALVDMVLKKGGKVQELFYKALSQAEPYLLEELEGHSLVPNPVSQEPTTPSVLRWLLEGLVSDELKALKWYLTQHAMEGCPPIRKSQIKKANRQETEEIMERHYGPKHATMIAQTILRKIMPISCVGIEGKGPWYSTVTQVEPVPRRREPSLKLLDPDMTPIMITPDVHEEGNMLRLQCPHAGVFQCSITGLVLEGEGEVTYWTLPWDKQFLSRKGKRPAGPMFKFTCLKGSFSQLHLPHCEKFSDGRLNVLSVAHVTDDRVEFIQPKRTTDEHVIINITGFSGFGLVKDNVLSSSASPINGMVLLFHQPSDDPDLYSSLYMLLLPRNALIPQVAKEWKRRTGAEYIEALPDCELIPNEAYKLSGTPAQLIQPEVAKFLNFDNYDNYTASFEVQLATDTKKVELVLMHGRKRPLHWPLTLLFGQEYSVVWRRVVKLNATPPSDTAAEEIGMTDLLLKTMNGLKSEEFRTFQRHLTHCTDPIPICTLEAADRMETVDRMVQRYHPAGAKDITVEILRKMDNNKLADDLQRW